MNKQSSAPRPRYTHFTCPFCTYTCQFQFHMLNHVYANHEDEIERFCPTCCRDFPSRKVRDTHEEQHAIEFPHKCNVCRARFRELLDLLKDGIGHSQRYLFFCQMCDAKFICGRYLKEHMSTHSSAETTITCGSCNETFFSSRRFKEHQSQCNLLNRRSRVTDPENASSFSAPDGGSMDKRATADDNRQSYRKETSSSAIDSSYRIPASSSDGTTGESICRPNPGEHMPTHSGAEPLLCDACNEAFPSRDHLNEHRSQCILLNRRIPHCRAKNASSSAASNGTRADEHVAADDIKPSSLKEMLSVSNARGNELPSSSGGERGEQRPQYQTRVAKKGYPMLKIQAPPKIIPFAKPNDKSCIGSGALFPQNFNPLSEVLTSNPTIIRLPYGGLRSQTSLFSRAPGSLLTFLTSRPENAENLPQRANLSVQRNSAEVSRTPSSTGANASTAVRQTNPQRRSETDLSPRTPGTFNPLRQGNAVNFPPYYSFQMGRISPADFMHRANVVSNASMSVSQPCVEQTSQTILRPETPRSNSSFRRDGRGSVENPPSNNLRMQNISPEAVRHPSNIDLHLLEEFNEVLPESSSIPLTESDPIDIDVHQYVTNRQAQQRSASTAFLLHDFLDAMNNTRPSWCICPIPHEEDLCM